MIDAQQQGRVFNILSGVNVTLQYLLIQNGNATKDTTNPNGGGIYNHGTLNIKNCTIQNNKAYDGGGIYNEEGSTLTLTGSNVYNNTANIMVMVVESTIITVNVTLTNSNIYNNTATEWWWNLQLMSG